jgi:hypothetical protein
MFDMWFGGVGCFGRRRLMLLLEKEVSCNRGVSSAFCSLQTAPRLLSIVAVTQKLPHRYVSFWLCRGAFVEKAPKYSRKLVTLSLLASNRDAGQNSIDECKEGFA